MNRKTIQGFVCKAVDSFFYNAMPAILELFACQVLIFDSEIDEAGEIQQATTRDPQVKACAGKRRQNYVWQTPQGSSDVHTLSHHTLFVLSQYFDNINMLFHEKHLPFTS